MMIRESPRELPQHEIMVINNVACLSPNGEISTDVLVLGRKGSKAPKSYYILYQGRRISPYEQRIKGWSFTLNGWLKLYYTPNPHLPQLISESPLLEFVLKDSNCSRY